jgi:hypothetical protein
MATQDIKTPIIPPIIPPIEPAQEGPPTPSIDVLITQEDPSVFERDTSKQLPLKIENVYGVDFSIFCRSLLEIPSNVPLMDVVNACILEGVSIVFNYDPFSKTNRTSAVFPHQIDVNNVQRESKNHTFSMKSTSKILLENDNGFILNVGLLNQVYTFLLATDFTIAKSKIDNLISRGLLGNFKEFDDIANDFISKTIIPNYLNFSKTPTLKQIFFKKYPKAKEGFLKIIQVSAIVTRFGIANLRSLSSFIDFISGTQKLESDDGVKEIFFASLGEMVKAQLTNISPQNVASKSNLLFDDFRIIYKIYYADIAIFDLIPILKPFVDNFKTAPKLTQLLSNKSYTIPKTILVIDTNKVLYLMAMFTNCMLSYERDITYFNAKVDKKTTFKGFLNSIPNLMIQDMQPLVEDNYLIEILKKYNIMAWSNTYLVKSAGNLIGLEFVDNKIEKTTVLNEYACSFDKLIDDVNLFDSYFIPKMDLSDPNLTNMGVLRKCYENMTRSFDKEASVIREDFLENIINVLSLDSFAQDTKDIKMNALDMIFYATLYVMQQYATSHCKILDADTIIKRKELDDMSTSELLLNEIKGNKNVALVGKLLLATTIAYMTTRIMTSNKR